MHNKVNNHFIMNKHLLHLPNNKIQCGLTSGDAHPSSGKAINAMLYEEFDMMSYTATKKLRNKTLVEEV